MAKSIADMFNRRVEQKLANTLRELPAIIVEEAIAFYQGNFDQQGWNGTTFDAWQKRKNPTKWGKKDEPNRKILIKTGAGRRSIRAGKIVENKGYVLAGGSPAPYMKAHNFGFRGQVQQNIRPFTRRVKGKKQQVRAFSRTINQNLPKRQFIGSPKQSPYLRARLRRAIKLELRHALK